MANSYRIIGLMSGSSLDGLDMADCLFTEQNGQWSFKILHSECAPYSAEVVSCLQNASTYSSRELVELSAVLGGLFAHHVNAFVQQHNIQKNEVACIASHGHTVFHHPEKHFTCQIGDGAALALHSGLQVVCDLRAADVAAGGQGAPIVPMADLHLFREAKLLLNIGGIANITFCDRKKMRAVAFDVCVANQILNALTQAIGKEYDAEGKLAAAGQVHQVLLDDLNQQTFFKRPYPKSLDNAFSRSVLLPIMARYELGLQDLLCTFCEHIAVQVAKQVQAIAMREGVSFSAQDQLLLTGGGAFNTFLAHRISAHCGVTVGIPDAQIVKFKEALAMAFLAAMRLRGEANVLASATGAARNTVNGALYLP